MKGLSAFPALLLLLSLAFAAEPAKPRRYYAYQGVEDRFGVIAPWYRGQKARIGCQIFFS